MSIGGVPVIEESPVGIFFALLDCCFLPLLRKESRPEIGWIQRLGGLSLDPRNLHRPPDCPLACLAQMF